MKPKALKKGDTIGVIAPSDCIVGEKVEEVLRAKEIVERDGFKVKFAKNLFARTNTYSATVHEKAEDLNSMFADEEVKMIWCAKGGENSNSLFEYIDYENIKKYPKIFCGFSDITSLSNMIHEKTGLVTFSGTNFKTIATDETDYSYKEVIKRFVDRSLEFGESPTGYKTIQEGVAEGDLIGGNLFLTRGMVAGKYSLDFTDKILFLEDVGLETIPAAISNHLYFMRQNGVFDKIKGLWLGNYQHESGITLEKLVKDVLEDDYNFPIIKSDNFGHLDTKTVIPIGVKARIDTSKEIKIELIENCIE